jgi:hypothetical protein
MKLQKCSLLGAVVGASILTTFLVPRANAVGLKPIEYFNFEGTSPLTSVVNGYTDLQGGGNDIELNVVAAVPEPSTWVGGALAFAALAYTQRRRFAQILRRA